MGGSFWLGGGRATSAILWRGACKRRRGGGSEERSRAEAGPRRDRGSDWTYVGKRQVGVERGRARGSRNRGRPRIVVLVGGAVRIHVGDGTMSPAPSIALWAAGRTGLSGFPWRSIAAGPLSRSWWCVVIRFCMSREWAEACTVATETSFFVPRLAAVRWRRRMTSRQSSKGHRLPSLRP